ncbi:MAG TPA: isochorismate synthase [Polyangiaceae bacterium]|nr:isochorismate synthase [Polyangiaceae bacterium]
MTSTASAPRANSAHEQKLREALASARSEQRGERFVSVEVPAPNSDAERLLDLDGASEARFWAEPTGYQFAGLGAVRVLTGAGPSRFREVSVAAQSLFSELGPIASRIRLFGGFAFQPGRAKSPEWRSFGEGRFVLPRIGFERRADGARLSLLFEAAELTDTSLVERTLALAESALEVLSSPVLPESAALEHAALEEREDSQFLELVDSVGAAITRGEFEKIVLARRVALALPRPLSASRVERRLAEIAPECLRFAFRVGSATFLGATPERLVSKVGRAFETEAVAGTVPISEVPAGRLMESTKNRAEQAIVVRELLRAFEPIAAALDHTPTPEIHRLRHIAHLRTKIRGQLREPLHVLDLVERLHPTPAVGGAPTAAALAWIAENEPDERGWYAGPIGWIDGAGDGAFAVALRSGLLERDRERATLYAGAGIVQGSDAQSELAETRWKLKPLLGAFGVAP